MSKFIVLLYAMLLGLLAACSADKSSEASFIATDITGAEFAKDFRLTDHTGVERKLADFQGKSVVLFFGYTHCPDICPTTMADLASAMKLLGEQSNEVQVVFITLDPEIGRAHV